MFSLTTFVIATGLRYAAWNHKNQKFLDAARIIYATDVIIFIVRLLQIFSVNKNLGPKLVMIRKMVSNALLVCVRPFSEPLLPFPATIRGFPFINEMKEGMSISTRQLLGEFWYTGISAF